MDSTREMASSSEMGVSNSYAAMRVFQCGLVRNGLLGAIERRRTGSEENRRAQHGGSLPVVGKGRERSFLNDSFGVLPRVCSPSRSRACVRVLFVRRGPIRRLKRCVCCGHPWPVLLLGQTIVSGVGTE